MSSLDTDNLLQPGDIRLYVANLSSADGSTSLADIGNIIDVSIETDIETLEHFSNRSGRRAKDKEVVTSISARVSFAFDEISTDNLRFFLYGTASTSASSIAFPDGTTASTGDQFHPLTAPLRDVAFEMMVKPTEGPAFMWQVDVAQFKANGSWDLDDAAWTAPPCSIEILASTVDGQEFGTFTRVPADATFS